MPFHSFAEQKNILMNGYNVKILTVWAGYVQFAGSV